MRVAWLLPLVFALIAAAGAASADCLLSIGVPLVGDVPVCV
ncbi:MAG TPA: hypothetical protein VGR28_13785 [Candidatus Thermoplasmatota archaeon]|jgi:hypothetical protein|nr:hypothetical protein [Candidatus Thermoplasmatota archaeon]